MRDFSYLLWKIFSALWYRGCCFLPKRYVVVSLLCITFPGPLICGCLRRFFYTFFDNRKNDIICVSRWSFKSMLIFMGITLMVTLWSKTIVLKQHLSHISYWMGFTLYWKLVFYSCNICYIFVCSNYLHDLYRIFDVIYILLKN